MSGPAPLLFGEDPARAAAGMFLVHGRSQSPETMVELVLDRLDLAELAVVLPRAEGASWYDAKAVEPLSAATGAQLDAALAQVAGDLAPLVEAGLPWMLAGFSQGACLALEYTLTGAGPRPTMLAALTGCRVGASGSERAAGADLSGVDAYLTDGQDDPWIPLANFAGAGAALAAAGARVRTDAFPGREHTVCNAEIAVLADILVALRAGRQAFGGGA